MNLTKPCVLKIKFLPSNKKFHLQNLNRYVLLQTTRIPLSYMNLQFFPQSIDTLIKSTEQIEKLLQELLVY